MSWLPHSAPNAANQQPPPPPAPPPRQHQHHLLPPSPGAPPPQSASAVAPPAPNWNFSLQPALDQFDTDTEQPHSPPPPLQVQAPSPTPAGSDATPSTAVPASSSPGLVQPHGPARRGRGGGSRGGISKRGARPPGALSHTKLCRDRLNGMFEQLRRTLPVAPVGVEVKHKAQVLDYAITVLKAMVRRTSELEIELAVSSNRATMEWVTKLVRATGVSFTHVAIEVMRVFTKRRHWGLAELWLAHKASGPHISGGAGGANAGGAASDPTAQPVRLVFGDFVVNDTVAATHTRGGEPLAAFVELSRAYAFAPGEGVQGRVWASMRPEWLAGLRETSDFARADLAARFGLKTCLAVPITVTGKIEAVMCFYDTRHRPYDSQCVDLAMRLAWALGNATGGKRAGTLDSDAAEARSK